MGNKLSTSQIPIIMTKTYVEEKFVHDLAVVEGLNIPELKRLVKMDGIESSLVLSLQFEHQRLLNIGNIWKFSLLTKLEIANNFIDEIEGLDSLSRLRHLVRFPIKVHFLIFFKL
ncbi:UNVERIFIED_CONTAM: Drc3 [Trichonephila clavipes]